MQDLKRDKFKNDFVSINTRQKDRMNLNMRHSKLNTSNSQFKKNPKLLLNLLLTLFCQ
jgi:hypothetical protein